MGIGNGMKKVIIGVFLGLQQFGVIPFEIRTLKKVTQRNGEH